MPQAIKRPTEIYRHKSQSTIPVDRVTGINICSECIQITRAVVDTLQACRTCIASNPKASDDCVIFKCTA